MRIFLVTGSSNKPFLSFPTSLFPRDILSVTFFINVALLTRLLLYKPYNNRLIALFAYVLFITRSALCISLIVPDMFILIIRMVLFLFVWVRHGSLHITIDFFSEDINMLYF